MIHYSIHIILQVRSHLGALSSINVQKWPIFLAASLFEQFSLVTHLRIDIERLAALNFSFLAGFDVIKK